MLHMLLCGIIWLTTNQSSFSATKLNRILKSREVGIVLEPKWQSWKSLIASGRSGAPGVLRGLLTLFLPLPPCRESRALPKTHLCVWRTQSTVWKLYRRVTDKNFYTWAGALVRIRQVMRKNARPSPQRRSFGYTSLCKFINLTFLPC